MPLEFPCLDLVVVEPCGSSTVHFYSQPNIGENRLSTTLVGTNDIYFGSTHPASICGSLPTHGESVHTPRPGCGLNYCWDTRKSGTGVPTCLPVPTTWCRVLRTWVLTLALESALTWDDKIQNLSQDSTELPEEKSL